ncbi:cytochrome c oxidase assembly factor Coa1 family protein [uncultured Aquimarina sp.]|uniref:cytochrome c oxidase assembly factor Coa1 family protein n=1 Tax=uncultured Aquimarina sp. TaxID=575652 RepID=UPI002614F4FC|nr:cytochrome c oxidase assembly factor Coa1 family protein [uncultured Aquimarina sp.]
MNNNELYTPNNWWKRNWKWLIPIIVIILIIPILLFSSGFGGHMSDFARLYSDKDLYQKAIEKAQSNQKVIELLGPLEPIDKLAILEGEVQYTNDNKSVDLSIRVSGSKRKASIDIAADKINGIWNYRKINIRIKKPVEDKQVIEVINQLE